MLICEDDIKKDTAEIICEDLNVFLVFANKLMPSTSISKIRELPVYGNSFE
jgi:hypothetical protein